MVSRKLIRINEFGERVETEVSGDGLVIEGDDGTELRPAHIKNASTTKNANSEAITNQCGDTEVRKNGDRNWDVTIEGLLTKDQLPSFYTIANQNTAEVHAEFLEDGVVGPLIVDSPTLKWEDETVSFKKVEANETEAAFPFQFMLKEESSTD